ncbi:hypothetical protein [Shewanella sp. NFH-SH190041]|uniref:hypothetical protein n=1 Tax=Shewanella sp. NFH-SH190041 TaxID=2950245 RepID=UPI00290574E5|nr:hypothetical protein [Shewanella sp. NFH-SH190041]
MAMINRILILLTMLMVGSAHAVVYDTIKYARSCSGSMQPMPVADVRDNLNFFKNNMGKWQITRIADGYVIMGSGYGNAVKKGSAAGIFCVPRSDSAAVAYKKIEYARQCAAGSFPVPVKDVPANMNFFRNNLGKWQIVRIGGGNVIMGGGYNYQVKPGSAYGVFCAYGEGDNSPVKYDTITHNRHCVAPTFPVPRKDVAANMDFFRKNLGTWQITQIADKHVIMGSGYNYAVKPGTAGYFFCAHPQNSFVIRDKATMDRIATDENYFKQLIAKYPVITMITSNGNTPSQTVDLPLGVAKDRQFIVQHRTSTKLKVNYVKGIIQFIYGIDAEIPTNQDISFKFNGERWLMESNKNVFSRSDFSDQNTLNQLLLRYRGITIRTTNQEWQPEIVLPSNGLGGTPNLHGTMVYFEQKSDQDVTIKYGTGERRTITPPKNSVTVFLNYWNFWYVVSERRVSDNSTLGKLGNNPALLKQQLEQYNTLILTTSDGNWTDSFTMPSAAEIGEQRMLVLRRNSSWGVKLKFPGVTVVPRRGATIRFNAFGDWAMFSNYVFYRKGDSQYVSTAAKIKQQLDKYGNISIALLDEDHLDDIYLPDNAVNGEFVRVYWRTGDRLTVHYSGKKLNVGGDSPTFYFDNGSWRIINFN